MEDAGAGSRSSAMAAVGAEDEEGAMGDVFYTCTPTPTETRAWMVDGSTPRSTQDEITETPKFPTMILPNGVPSPLCGRVACGLRRARRGGGLILRPVSSSSFAESWNGMKNIGNGTLD